MSEAEEKKVINPAEDFTYKPVRQVFGSVFCGFLMMIEVVLLILACSLLYDTLDNKHGVYRTIIKLINFLSNQGLNYNNAYYRILCDITYNDKVMYILGFGVLFSLSLIIEIIFFGVILFNPAYCGGNPKFYKTWPIILSGFFGALSGYFLRISIPICLILFGIKYFMYFRNDNLGPCCCGCGCFKPWVYKKIVDDEAPEYLY